MFVTSGIGQLLSRQLEHVEDAYDVCDEMNHLWIIGYHFV